MKKLLIALMAAVLSTGVFAAGHDAFPDIPEGHWAGEAVDRIADLGIVIGFPDGTFRGNEAFTRYQAALVISRMLDVVMAEMDAAMAMSASDMAALRNAVQDLAADVAAQGDRIGAAEGAIAGLADDVSATAAEAAELAAMIAGMDMKAEMDPAVLADIENQLAALGVAVDSAQAAADAAAGAAAGAAAAASDAAGAAGAAGAAAAQAAGAAAGNASEIAALNSIVQILGDQIEALQADLGGMDAASADALAAVEGDVANIREFVILLRRDQVAIRDRVSALEASDEAQSADIADLQARVSALEENPLNLSGSISVDYMTQRTNDANLVALASFDIDRAYGANADREVGPSAFSTGDQDLNGSGSITSGEFAQDLVDFDYGSDIDASISIGFSGGYAFDGEGSPRGLNSFSSVATFDLVEVVDAGGIEHYGIEFDDFTSTFDPIGAAPLTFAFGPEVTGSFTPYTLNLEDAGFVATLGAPDMLAAFDPTLSIVYLTNDANGADAAYVLTGVRGTLSPIAGVTGGFSYVRNAVAGGLLDIADESDDNIDDLIWGVDAQATLGPISLAAEYANGTGNDGANTGDSVLYVTADVMLDILGGVDISANYRDIDLDWDGGFAAGAAVIPDGDYAPFVEDQAGFAVTAGLSLFIFDIDVYADSYDIDAVMPTLAYGVDVSAPLFAGFSMGGYFHQVSVDGNLADDNSATERDSSYDTGFGVSLSHDGGSADALIANLDLEFSYDQTTVDYNVVDIMASAEYSLDVSIVSLTPYASYESNADGDADTGMTEIKAGLGATTAALDMIFAPSFGAVVNYRTASYTAGGADLFSASELQWAVEVNLAEFLLPYSSLSARYGSFTGTNVTAGVLTAGDVDTGDISIATSGWEVVWNYYDLVFSYGMYTDDPDTATADDEISAQAFGVSYAVSW